MIMLKLTIERLGHPHPQSILYAENWIGVIPHLGSLGASPVVFVSMLGISGVAFPCGSAFTLLAHALPAVCICLVPVEIHHELPLVTYLADLHAKLPSYTHTLDARSDSFFGCSNATSLACLIYSVPLKSASSVTKHSQSLSLGA